MKTTSLSSSLILGLFVTLPALADWSAPVTYAEVIFGCDGTTPVFTQNFGVNVDAGIHGELRLPADVAASLLASATTTPATCTVEDAGEAASPSWNQIIFAEGTKLVLSLSPDFNSCAADAVNDGFNRDNHYSLNVTRTDGSLANYSWTESAHFSSPTACQTFE